MIEDKKNYYKEITSDKSKSYGFRFGRNKKQETRNKKQETRNKKQETRNKKQETRNKKQETRNKLYIQCLKNIYLKSAPQILFL